MAADTTSITTDVVTDETIAKQIFDYIESNKVEECKALIEKQLTVESNRNRDFILNEWSKDGWSLLLRAVYKNNLEIAKLLLSANVCRSPSYSHCLYVRVVSTSGQYK